MQLKIIFNFILHTGKNGYNKTKGLKDTCEKKENE